MLKAGYLGLKNCDTSVICWLKSLHAVNALTFTDRGSLSSKSNPKWSSTHSNVLQIILNILTIARLTREPSHDMDTFEEEIFNDIFFEGSLMPLIPEDDIGDYEDFLFSVEDLKFLEESSCGRNESDCVHIRWGWTGWRMKILPQTSQMIASRSKSQVTNIFPYNHVGLIKAVVQGW